MSIKVIRLPKNKMPAPAFTDANNIYICKEAREHEFNLLYKHEAGHIFLEHHLRRPKNKSARKHDDKWKLACELEIARNIYEEKDIELIKRPFSVLSGSVCPDTVKDLPEDLKIAEHIYKWLIKNQKEKQEDKCCATLKIQQHEKDEKQEQQKGKEGQEEQEGQEEKEQQKELSEEEIKKIKDFIEKATKELKVSLNNINKVNYPIKTIKTSIKPSLASEIDYILRSKNKRQRTYARESRVKSELFLLKGRKTIKKSPQIEIFVDRSGSFQGYRTQKSLEVIKDILKKYNVKVRTDFFYFSNGKLYNKDVPANGGNPYPLVMNHLEQSRPKIAIILTDDDQEGDLKPLSHKHTKIICVPIGVSHTSIARMIGAKDVNI